MDELKKIPPVTRTLLASTGGVSLAYMLGIIQPWSLVLDWQLATQKFQIYRLFTCFFLGPKSMKLLFDAFMLHRNSSDLELNHYTRRTADYGWSLIVTGALIVAFSYPLQSVVLYRPMLLAVTYLWARANPSASVSFWGLFSCPSKFVPYIYLLFDFIDEAGGGVAGVMQSSTGLMAAYVYWYLAEVLPSSRGGRGPRYIPTPQFLRRLLPDSQDPSAAAYNMGDRPARQTSYGMAWNAGQTLGSGSSTLSSSSSSPSRSWFPASLSRSWFSSSSNRTESTAGGPTREELLNAAERRIRKQQASTIMARHFESSSSSSSSKQGSSSVNPRPATSSTSSLRKTTSTSAKASTFGQLKQRETSTNNNDEDEDASSSGGRVAELRKNQDPLPSSSTQSKENSTKVTSDSWGQGNRLGD